MARWDTGSRCGRPFLIGSYDIAVIGAGPAGSLTAFALARRGHHVVMLEEHELVGRPVHCTGLLGYEAFDEFNLPRSLILGEATSARFWAASGLSVSVTSERVRAAVIDRADLDAHLSAQAAAAGVDVRCGWRATRIETTGPTVTIHGQQSDTEVRARAVVLACGANYRFHAQLGLGLPDVYLQSAQLETPFPAESDPHVEVRFGREVAPGGFGWMLPFKREGEPHARIGLMTEDGSKPRFEALLRTLCERAGVDRASIPQPRLKMLPLGPVPRTYGNRVVAVGDAAGLVKPTTGGGIYYGLLSGAIAADVLADALSRDRLDQRALSAYQGQWKRRLGPEIRAALKFRRLAAPLPDESIDALIDLARVNGIIPLLHKEASFNWHRKAAMALMSHAAFRRIMLQSFLRSGGLR